ncbi:L,D-transpeptidase [Frankia sp. CNm7]|uniref:L,D-transpeptidase n=1 Tax=Frankia nepalensis TaxID=1836974 RepID=A0A937RI33_9ACTN|nr:L,D-transpeptidase [Frankia nepalensis]MBL7512345.1 L,D-transpeptidase [Frankia nepalensis]MBL7517659.1 L,D-transpeptidase [Frankia nepalensis]MBL7632643.1 L,D-transpeptidase [Frankia nepalensis]
MAARRWYVAALSLAAGVLAALLLTIGRTDRPGSPLGGPPGAGVSAGVTVPPDLTVIAQLSHDVPRFSEPDEGARVGVVPGRWRGGAAALPVIDSRPGWLRVRLAQRPNFSTAWIRATDARLVTSAYRIEVDVTAMRLRLYERDRLTLDAPAGVGVPDNPTPAGEFFLALFAAPPGPGYGDFILVTSAHSETITDWDSSGDAIVGIHGPLGAEEEIGTTGARVSHGCVRLHLADLARLRAVPAGSPVTITGGSTP